jgi:hypothetical protein
VIFAVSALLRKTREKIPWPWSVVLTWARRHLLLTEKSHVIDAFRQGLLDQTVYEKLLADIDARLLRLESGEEEKTTEAQPVATNGD